MNAVHWFTLLAAWASVALMAYTVHKLRKQLVAMSAAITALMFAAANMWSALTPEQIRGLHPRTVDIGNHGPSWDEIQGFIRQAHNNQQRRQGQ